MKPSPFRDGEERDELRWRIDRLDYTARELAALRADPAMRPYLLTVAGSEMPGLPTASDMVAACAVLEQTAVCLRHHYRQRCRDDDDLDMIRVRKPGDLDDEPPFSDSQNLPPAGFPGTLYDGDGTRLAGDGPELTLEMTEGFAFKALLHGKPGAVDIAVLEAGDRLWLLPDNFGTPPELPVPLLAELASIVRRGRKVGLAASNHGAYALVRDALMLLLDDSGGRA